MEDKSLKKLLDACGCNDISELWNYIDYLEYVKTDYDFLKAQVRNTYIVMQELY